MNCDQVFDILTRGPFPTGTDCDEPVETHLNGCPECRRLAEALRPALELFQEAIDPEESGDLPGYWSAAATERHAVVSYAPEVESRHLPHPGAGGTAANPIGNWSALTAWRMAAMLAVGITFGLLLSARTVFDDSPWSPFATDAQRAPVPQVDESKSQLVDRLQLASLPAACVPGQGDAAQRPIRQRRPASLGVQLARLDCCSECHHAGSQLAVPAAATTRVAQSCQLCHAGQRLSRFEAR